MKDEIFFGSNEVPKKGVDSISFHCLIILDIFFIFTFTSHLFPSPAKFRAWQENSPCIPSVTSNCVAEENIAAESEI